MNAEYHVPTTSAGEGCWRHSRNMMLVVFALVGFSNDTACVTSRLLSCAFLAEYAGEDELRIRTIQNAYLMHLLFTPIDEISHGHSQHNDTTTEYTPTWEAGITFSKLDLGRSWFRPRIIAGRSSRPPSLLTVATFRGLAITPLLKVQPIHVSKYSQSVKVLFLTIFFLLQLLQVVLMMGISLRQLVE